MDFLEQDFTPEQLERSARYKRETRVLRRVSLGVGLAVPLLLGFTHVGAWLVGEAGDLAGGGWIARAVLGSVALSLLGFVVGTPTSMRGEVVSRHWGLSKRSWGLYWADRTKGLVIGAILTAAAVLGFYALMRHVPGTWWVWAGLAAAAFAVLGSFAMPVLIEPLFNKFAPLEEGELRTRLMAVVADSGVNVRDILVSDSSRRTTALNAYVSGFGRTRRLVVWDTTVEGLPADEIAAVAAHELGHAARRDVLAGTVIGAVGAAFTVAVLALALQWDWLLSAAGVHAASDPRSQALVRALLVVFGACGEPVMLAYSRRIETRADGYALDLVRDPDAVVRVWRGLGVRNIADLRPTRVEVLALYSHPPIPTRIAHARRWASENGVAIPSGLSGTAQEPGAP